MSEHEAADFVGVPTSAGTLEPSSSARPDGPLAAILIEKHAPRDVLPNEPVEYTVRLTNHATTTVASVVLVESVPSYLAIEDCSPPSQLREPHTRRWILGPIMPMASVDVRVVVRAKRKQTFCSHTSLSFSSIA